MFDGVGTALSDTFKVKNGFPVLLFVEGLLCKVFLLQQFSDK